MLEKAWKAFSPQRHRGQRGQSRAGPLGGFADQMSFEFSITTTTDRLPSVQAWNDALRERGFDVSLGDFRWDSQAGFLPVRVASVQSGFEMYVETVAQKRSLLGLFSRSDPQVRRVTARLGGSHLGCTAAVVSFAVLEALTGGTYAADLGDPKLPATQRMAEAQGTYSQTRFLLARLNEPLGLAAQVPVLQDWETEAARQEMIQSLLAQRSIVEVKEGSVVSYRLHKGEQERLSEEIDQSSEIGE